MKTIGSDFKITPGIIAVSLMSIFLNFPIAAVAQNTLQEVTVTAQRRAESLQDVPIMVNTFNNEQLSESGIDDLFEIANTVPGMIFGRAGDDGLLLTIRGLGSPARSPVFEQSVAFFSDGLFYGKGRYYSVPFFDVERIEFIKGTQSTLLGKNSSIGAISLISRSPGDEFGGNFRIETEVEHGGYTVQGGVDVPISDKFKLRLAAHSADIDGWLRNVTLNRAFPNDKNQAFRAIAEFIPLENLTARLIYQRSDTERFGANTQIINPKVTPPGEDGVFNNRATQFTSKTPSNASENDTDVEMINFSLDADVFNDHTLVSQTTYSRYNVDFFDDFDMSSLDEVLLIKDEEYEQFTQEFRLLSPTDGRLEYMLGLYYLDSNWHMIETLDASVPNFPPGTAQAGQVWNGPFANNFKQDTRTLSGFASGTFHVNDKLRFSGGLRYTSERKDILYGRFAFQPLTLWNTVINPPFPFTPLDFSDDFLDGNGNIQYDINEDVMLFAAYGRGTKTGGYVDTNTAPNANPKVESFIGSETTDTYEVGVKARLMDNRLLLNGALFYIDVTDLQETTFTGTEFITSNLPAESKGLDFDLKYLASERLTLTANGVWLNSKVIINGERFRPTQSPSFSGSLGFSYERSLGSNLYWRLSGAARARTKIFHQRGNLFPSKGVTTFDASLTIGSQNGKWDASIIARNMSNEFIIDFASPTPHPLNGNTYSTAHLRAIKLAFGFNF